MPLPPAFPRRTEREQMLEEYKEVHQRLGDHVAPDEAAAIMYDLLKTRRNQLLQQARERVEAERKQAEALAEKARLEAQKYTEELQELSGNHELPK